MLRKAAILQNDGDVDEARIVLIDFLDSFPNHPLLDQGLLSLGSLFQEDGEAEKAKGYFEQINPESYLAPLAKMLVGDMAAETQDWEVARNTYSQIQRQYPDTQWTNSIKVRLEQVEKELSDPEFPSVVPAPPMPEEPTESVEAEEEPGETSDAPEEQETSVAEEDDEDAP